MRARVGLRSILVGLSIWGGVHAASIPLSVPATYHAVTNRTVYPEPALPSIGAAGSRFIDRTFGSRMLRVSDANTRPGRAGRGYAGPSAAHQLAWNATSSRFYIRGIDGWFIPYNFDAVSMTATRLPSATPNDGNGGLVISSQVEPQFSFVQPDILFATGQDSLNDWPIVRYFNFSTGTYTDILNLGNQTTINPATYAAALSSSATSPEKLSVIFGGCCQDAHYKVAVFDVAAPTTSLMLLDTQAGTITAGGKTIPTGVVPFFLHHAWIDLSGQYVVLYPRSQSPVSFIIWNLSTQTLTLNNTLPFGHDALGYGWQVNQDCCTSGGAYDGAQWQLRALSAPAATSDLINPPLSPREIYLADHTSWNNAQPDRRVPILSSTYRYYNGTFNTTPWRPWDDEIIAIQTDGGGAATVWRFAHHRSNIQRDDGIDGTYFWYQPHAVISPDGRWALFTSNWEKTLGTAVGSEPSGLYRTDVFLVSLAAGPFTDDQIVGTGTFIRASHITELRTRIDVQRVRFGLATFPWTDPGLGPGMVVQAAHLTEMRAALSQANQAAGRGPLGFTDTITARSTIVRAIHIQELRNAVVALEGL
jgi:hypothetical protein